MSFEDTAANWDTTILVYHDYAREYPNLALHGAEQSIPNKF